jgi:hypothetical protein
MRRRRWLPLWSLAAAVAAGAGLWATGSKPPRLPADRDHALLQTESACLHCHAHTAAHPRPKGHPLRDDCFSCHRDPEGVLHPRPGAALSLPGGWRDDPRLAGTPRR